LRRSTTARCWRERDFLLYSLGNAISYIGSWAQRIGIGWLSWELTQSSTWVGCIALAQYLPLIVLSPFFGVLLDRQERRGYALVVNGSSRCCRGTLRADAHVTGMNIQILLGLRHPLGNRQQCVSSRPARDGQRRGETEAARAGDRNQFHRVQPHARGRSGGCRDSHCAPGGGCGVRCQCYLVYRDPRRVVDHRPAAPSARAARKGLLVESREGFAYASTHPRLCGLLILAAITAVLGRGGLELLPAFSALIFNRAAPARRAEYCSRRRCDHRCRDSVANRDRPLLAALTRYATLAVGVLLAAFGASSNYIAGLVIMTAFGLAMILCSVGLQTLLQSALDDRYRGRVLGLWSA